MVFQTYSANQSDLVILSDAVNDRNIVTFGNLGQLVLSQPQGLMARVSLKLDSISLILRGFKVIVHIIVVMGTGLNIGPSQSVEVGALQTVGIVALLRLMPPSCSHKLDIRFLR